MSRILIAFDKFKHALEAAEACSLAAEILTQTHPGLNLDLCPLTDGGEGFAQILTRASGGQWTPQQVTGPRSTPVPAGIGWIHLETIPLPVRTRLAFPPGTAGRIALIEMALASGLESLPPEQRNPGLTHSTGTGELIRTACEHGAAGILLGIGGSATNDAGLGALAALGLQPVDAAGTPVTPPHPQAWPRIAAFRGTLPANPPPIRIACDVTNPLLGPRGCTAVYGPQKGLKPEDLPALEAQMQTLSAKLCEHFSQPLTLRDTPGAGAAGGIGFGLRCALPDTAFIPGADLVSDWLDLPRRLAAADLILTGEGRFDASSLTGKGPGALLQHAARLGKPVLLLCGSIAPGLPLPPTVRARAITPPDMPLPEALKRAPHLLKSTLHSIPLPLPDLLQPESGRPPAPGSHT